jgi:hypothetical protein
MSSGLRFYFHFHRQDCKKKFPRLDTSNHSPTILKLTIRQVITYGFDQFQTYIGPGTKPADHSKNCQLHLNLKYPGGFQYAVVDATYHGFARLDAGVTGTFLTTYYFSQDAGKTVRKTFSSTKSPTFPLSTSE